MTQMIKGESKKKERKKNTYYSLPIGLFISCDGRFTSHERPS